MFSPHRFFPSLNIKAPLVGELSDDEVTGVLEVEEESRDSLGEAQSPQF